MTEMQIPGSSVTIRLTDAFSQEGLADLTRRIVADPLVAEIVRANPADELRKYGVEILGDVKDLEDQSVLAALGHRPSNSPGLADNTMAEGPQNAVVVVTVVSIAIHVNPDPTDDLEDV